MLPAIFPEAFMPRTPGIYADQVDTIEIPEEAIAEMEAETREIEVRAQEAYDRHRLARRYVRE